MKKLQSKCWKRLPWILLVCGYLGTVALLALVGRPYLDSDASSEMVLANLLNQEGTLLSTNWWYSSELRVF